MSDTTHLYRHFDKNGHLLYVGISLSAVHRLSQHEKHSHWFTEIKTVEIEAFDSREQAIAAEREAVANEKPICNIRLKQSSKLPEVIAQARKSREELFGRTVRFGISYESTEIARELGIPHKKVLADMDSGKLGYFEFLGRKSGPWEAKIKRRSTGWQFIDYIEYIQGERIDD